MKVTLDHFTLREEKICLFGIHPDPEVGLLEK